MTFTFDPATIIIAVIALLIGLFIGSLAGSAARRRVRQLDTELGLALRERDEALGDRDRALTEVRARDAQIRPLSDEVDKLRRDLARARALPAAAPAAAASNDAAAPAVDLGNVRLLKGVGPKFADRLTAAGVVRIDQLAGLSGAQAAALDAGMGDFAGRIASDRLVEQAQLLADGRVTEYETRFGKLGG